MFKNSIESSKHTEFVVNRALGAANTTTSTKDESIQPFIVVSICVILYNESATVPEFFKVMFGFLIVSLFKLFAFPKYNFLSFY